MYSCSSDDEPISIEGSWIVTKWSDGGKMVTPDKVVRWRFSNGKASCLGETKPYSLDGNKLKIGSQTYTVKFVDTYTMQWQGGYGHYKKVQLTKDF